VKQSIWVWAGVISRLRLVGAGGEIADGLAQGNGMLAHNRPPIAAGRTQIWLELPQLDTGLLRCFRRSENEGSPEIRHPILLAPMDLVADARLAASVTHAGGFGILGGGYGDEAWLTRELDAAAGVPVGVGFITWSLAKQPRLLDLVLERDPPAIMLSFGDPGPFADRIKARGTRLICQVQTVALARDAVDKGADIVVAQGTEGGGHGGMCATLPLVPAIVDAVGSQVPVAAAGGIADGRGLAAALVLGADGACIGTRFYASAEAAGHPAAKSRIVAAEGEQTTRGILFDIARRNVWPAPFTGRVLVNDHSERWQGRERELMQHIAAEGARYDEARAAGDFDTAAVIAGECSGLIHAVEPVSVIVTRMVREAEAAIQRRAPPARMELDRMMSHSPA